MSSSRRSCVLVYNSLFFLEGKGSVALVESEGAAQALQDFGPGHVPKRTVNVCPMGWGFTLSCTYDPA